MHQKKQIEKSQFLFAITQLWLIVMNNQNTTKASSWHPSIRHQQTNKQINTARPSLHCTASLTVYSLALVQILHSVFLGNATQMIVSLSLHLCCVEHAISTGSRYLVVTLTGRSDGRRDGLIAAAMTTSLHNIYTYIHTNIQTYIRTYIHTHIYKQTYIRTQTTVTKKQD